MLAYGWRRDIPARGPRQIEKALVTPIGLG
jgi:hypothetical protein